MVKQIRKPWKLLTICGLTLTLLAGCGQAQNAKTNADTSPKPEATASTQAPQQGGVLRIAVQNDVDGLDPHRTVSASTFQVTNNIYDTLVGTDAGGNLIPRLATKWTPSADGKSYTFELRDDVQFHNGRKFTSEDAKFSLQRLMEKASPRAGDYALIEDIVVDSPTKLTIKLKETNAPFVSSLAMPWAAIVPKDAVDQLKTQPVGTGAFVFKEWTPQQKVVLEKNKSYYVKGRPYLDSAEFCVIPDTATQLINLKSGQIDVASVDGEQADRLKQDPNITLFTKPSNAVQIMALNNAVPPLDNPKVRQAINLAVDKNTVIAGANWGFGDPIGSHMSPADPFYVDKNNVWKSDIAKAKALLKEAGFEKGFDITLSLPQPYAIHVKAGQVAADQLKQIGINVKLETVDWGKWVKDIYTGRNYQMTVVSHTGRLDPDAMLSRYASDSKENYMNYKNASIDEFLKKGRTVTDMAERKKIYASIQDQLAQDVPAVFLQTPRTLMGLSKKVKGLETYPIDIYELSTISLTK